jgi:hypothetical protein
MGVGSFFQKVAPWIAAGVQFVPGAGPVLAGTISKIASEHGVQLPSAVEPTVESIGNAVAAMTGNSAAMLALKQQDQTYAEQMQAMGFKQIQDLEKLAMDDRADARARQIAVRDRMPAILAVLINVGFFGIVILMMFHVIPAGVKDVAFMLLGALAAAWKDVYGYYFGSSAGSSAKTDALADIAKQP